MIALRTAAHARHPFRAKLFGTLPRELREPELWRYAALFVPVALALFGAVLVVTP